MNRSLSTRLRVRVHHDPFVRFIPLELVAATNSLLNQTLHIRPDKVDAVVEVQLGRCIVYMSGEPFAVDQSAEEVIREIQSDAFLPANGQWGC